jgi:hypothetical protein
MFASLGSLLAGSLIAGFLVMKSEPVRVTEDLEALLARIRQRLYPGTLPVLASYWLKTVEASGYGRRQWKKLSRLLNRGLGEQLPDAPLVRPSLAFRPGSSRRLVSPGDHRNPSLRARNVFVPL